MPDDHAGLVRVLTSELEKSAWVARAHRELQKRGLCRHDQGENRVRVSVELDVEIHEGHPAAVLVALREHLRHLSLHTDLDASLSVRQVEKIFIS